MSEAPKKVELTELEILEGSPVGKGDNPPAVISFWKSAGGGPSLLEKVKALWARMTKGGDYPPMMGEMKCQHGMKKDECPECCMNMDLEQPRTVGQILAMKEFGEAFYALKEAFAQSISSIMEMAPAEQMGALLSQTVAEFNDRAGALAATIQGTQKSADLTKVLDVLAKSVGDQDAFAVAVEQLEGFNQPKTKEKKMDPSVEKTDPELAPIAPAPAPTPAPEVTKAMQDMTKQLEDAKKDAADARALVLKMEAERIDQEFMAKAKTLAVPGLTLDEVSKSLRMAHQANPEVGAQIERAFAALAAQVQKNDQLTKVIGRAGDPPAGTMTAYAELTKKAEEIRKADPKLTKEQAFVRAGQMYPALKEQAIHNEETAV